MASVLALVLIIFIQNCIAQKTPTITHITRDHQIKNIGTTVRLECSVKDADDYAIIWRKFDPQTNVNITLSTGKSIIHKDAKLSIRYDKSTSTYTLQIQNLSESDVAIYYCEIIPGFPQVSASVELQVSRPPVILDNSTRSVITMEGEDLLVECYADGYPTPTITWKREYDRVFQTGDAIHQGNVLLIESIRKQDRGTYYCIADNQVGHGTRRNVNVAVEFAPMVTVPNSTVSQTLQHDIDLVCRIEAYPPPVVTWFKDDVSLSFMSFISQDHTISYFSTSNEILDTVLRIKSIDKKQYGKYVCKAANKLGTAEGEIELLESSKPL